MTGIVTPPLHLHHDHSDTWKNFKYLIIVSHTVKESMLQKLPTFT